MKKFNRKIILAKVIKKLSKTEVDPQSIEMLIGRLRGVYQKNQNKDFKDLFLPKEILKVMGDFMDKHILEQRDKLLILKEAKRNKFFDFTINKNLEKAWRLILKKWNLSNYRLEGGL